MTAPTATIAYDHLTDEFTVTVVGKRTNDKMTDTLWGLNHRNQPVSDTHANTLPPAVGRRITKTFLADVVADTPAVVPAAPTNVSATVTHDTATFTFTVPRNGGAAITNYEVYNGTAWVALSPADTSSPISKGGFTPESTVGLKIRAVNSVGAGAASATVTKTFAAAP